MFHLAIKDSVLRFHPNLGEGRMQVALEVVDRHHGERESGTTASANAASEPEDEFRRCHARNLTTHEQMAKLAVAIFGRDAGRHDLSGAAMWTHGRASVHHFWRLELLDGRDTTDRVADVARNLVGGVRVDFYRVPSFVH